MPKATEIQYKGEHLQLRAPHLFPKKKLSMSNSPQLPSSTAATGGHSQQGSDSSQASINRNTVMNLIENATESLVKENLNMHAKISALEGQVYSLKSDIKELIEARFTEVTDTLVKILASCEQLTAAGELDANKES
ncbi:hypothetical protein C8J56DRAFT_1056745 [Mycena floridula]|nr:hypothetical protein C8J56DRAFT_1056745 [Mycena floridula]